MRLLDRHTPPLQSNGALQTVRQVLGEAQNLNNPVVAATAAMVVGIGIGFAVSSLLASKDDEIRRLRADADELKQRIEKLGT
jgi:predicted amino acid dehydrogenase